MRIRHLDKVCRGLHVSYDVLMFAIGFCQGGADRKQGKRKQVKMAVRTNVMTVSDAKFIYVTVYQLRGGL